MIKCNVTITGSVSKEAQVRESKNGSPYTTFGVRVSVNDRDGIRRAIDVSVIKDGTANTAEYSVGRRIEMTGVMTFRKRGDALYLNFSLETEKFESVPQEDSIKGELHMLGTAGKSIEEKTTKNGRPMLVLSAYSSEKTDEGFAFTWVNFVQFDAARPDWLQPKATIEAKGELEITPAAGRIFLGCRLSELKPWDKPAYVPRQPQQPTQSNPREDMPF